MNIQLSKLVNKTLESAIESVSIGSAILSGQAVVSQASTATQIIAASTPLKNGLIVQALEANGGTVFVGGSNLAPAGEERCNGFELQAGQATSIAIDNANKVYIMAANINDGVCWIGAY